MSEVSCYSVPLSLGHRACDLALASMAAVCGVSTPAVMGHLHRLWHSVAMDPQGQRLVPAERSAWSSCRDVWVLEAGAGWGGERGDLFTMCVDAGVIELHPASAQEGMRRVVLAGWVEANRQGVSVKKLAALGGIAKARNRAKKDAEVDADELLAWFKRNQVALFSETGVDETRAALVFVRQIERIMRWVPATDRTFLQTAVTKSLHALRFLGQDRDTLLSWLVAHRERDIIPGRVDLLLAEVENLHGHAKKWMEALQ